MAIEELSDHREVDWLGNEYGVGDMVIYPRMSGRSVEQIVGKVVSFYKSHSAYSTAPAWVRARIEVHGGSRFTSRVEPGDPYGPKIVNITLMKNITKL